MECHILLWISSINMCLNLGTIWALILLFADQRRIEKRYEGLLHNLKGERE